MTLIAAVDKNWAIGYNNQLLTRIPEDMKNFRRLTTGKTVVMGRRTLESFPNAVVLPNRTNIIFTRNKDYVVRNGIVVHDLEGLKESLEGTPDEDIFIIGGQSIYKQLEPYCSKAIITKIDFSYQADAYFPNLDEKENWVLLDESEESTYFDIVFTFNTYNNNDVKGL